MHPAITTTGESPLLLCKLMILTCVTSGGISGVETASIRDESSSSGLAAVDAKSSTMERSPSIPSMSS